MIDSSQLQLFIRTDNKEKINNEKLSEYKVTPAFHLNIQTSETGAQKYEGSGFLSTFEFDKGYGFKKAVDYALKAGSKHIHFIFLPDGISEKINLTGGTKGFEEVGKPKQVDGSVWMMPFFQRKIPQLFYTISVDVQLPPTLQREAYEVLLGGNWVSFAQVISIEIKNLQSDTHQILNGKTEKEVQIWLEELRYKCYTPEGVAKDQLSVDESAQIAQLLNWWNKQSPEDQANLNYLYRVMNNKKLEKASPDDYDLLRQLQAISRLKERNEPYYQNLLTAVDYFNSLRELGKKYDEQMENFITLGFGKILFIHDQNLISSEEERELTETLGSFVTFLKEEFRLARLSKTIESEMKNPLNISMEFPYYFSKLDFVFHPNSVLLFKSLDDFVKRYTGHMDEMHNVSSDEINAKLKPYRTLNKYIKENKIIERYFAPIEELWPLNMEVIFRLKSFYYEYGIRCLELSIDSKNIPAHDDLMEGIKQFESKILFPILSSVYNYAIRVLLGENKAVACLELYSKIVELSPTLMSLKQQIVRSDISLGFFQQPAQTNQKRSSSQHDDQQSEVNPKRFRQ